jgi:hypothetical protein
MELGDEGGISLVETSDWVGKRDETRRGNEITPARKFINLFSDGEGFSLQRCHRLVPKVPR